MRRPENPKDQKRSEIARVPSEALLSCADIADWLGVGTRTWWRWTTCGKGPRPDLHLGRVVRWRRSTIEQWLSEQGMRSDTRQWEG